MMHRSRPLTGLISLALLGACMAALAAQTKTQQALITCDKKAVYNWKTGELVFSGNCRVEIKGEDKATMTTEQLSGKFSPDGSSVVKLTAAGPVHFDITTAPDENGVKRLITAECKGQALFMGQERQVRLTGGAEALMETLPKQPNVDPAKLTGKEIVIDLDTFDVTVEGPVFMQVDIPSSSAPQTPPAGSGGGQ